MNPNTTCTRDATAEYMATMAKMYGMTNEQQIIFKKNLDHQHAVHVRKRLEADDKFWFFLEESYGKWLTENNRKEEAYGQRLNEILRMNK